MEGSADTFVRISGRGEPTGKVDCAPLIVVLNESQFHHEGLEEEGKRRSRSL